MSQVSQLIFTQVRSIHTGLAAETQSHINNNEEHGVEPHPHRTRGSRTTPQVLGHTLTAQEVHKATSTTWCWVTPSPWCCHTVREVHKAVACTRPLLHHKRSRREIGREVVCRWLNCVQHTRGGWSQPLDNIAAGVDVPETVGPLRLHATRNIMMTLWETITRRIHDQIFAEFLCWCRLL